MSGKTQSDQSMNEIKVKMEEDDKNLSEIVPANTENKYGKETTVYQISENLNSEQNTGESLFGGKNLTVAQQMESYDHDDDDDDHEDPRSRNSFLLKILVIDLFLLFITAGFIYMVYTTPTARMLFLKHFEKFAIGGMVMVVPAVCLMNSECARKGIIGCLLLVVLVCGTCLMSAAVTARYRTGVILVAFGGTAAVVFVCIILAFTPFDFTKYWLCVIGLSVALMVVSIGYMIYVYFSGEHFRTVTLVFHILATLLSSVTLIMQIQAIVGGKTVELSEDEYILGAAMIYSSIINIFLNLAGIADHFDE